MKRTVYILLLAIVISCLIPMPAEAQALEKAAKAIEGFFNAINNVTKKNTSNKSVNSEDQNPSIVNSANPTPPSNKKTVYIEAIYPAANYWLGWNEKTKFQVQISIFREERKGESNQLCWGELSMIKGKYECEGLLDNPSKDGDAYSFDIKSSKGDSHITVKKGRNSKYPKGAVMTILNISGFLSKWIPVGFVLECRAGFDTEDDPTAFVITEKELDEVLKESNAKSFIDYNWWMKNRNNSVSENSATILNTYDIAPLITDQTRFIGAKGNGGVNVRSNADMKASKIGTLFSDQILPVVGGKNGWYQILMTDGKKGWVNSSVCSIIEKRINIEDVCDHVYGISDSYDEYAGWIVGAVEGTDLYVAITMASNTDTFLFPWYECFWLGKKVGNVIAFDRYVIISSFYDENMGQMEIIKENNSEGLYYILKYGNQNCMPDNQGGNVFRPSSITEKIIKQLFNGNEHKGRYLFLGPDMFTNKYANVIFG